MKSKNLLGIAQFALMFAIGITQLHQALPVMAKAAHRTAAPLGQVILLGVTPSYPASPAPAAQPFVTYTHYTHHTPAATVTSVHVRNAVLRVEAQRPMVETISAPVPARITITPRRFAMVRASLDAQAFAELERMRIEQVDQARIQHEMARAQHEIQVTIERTRRQAEHRQVVRF